MLFTASFPEGFFHTIIDNPILVNSRVFAFRSNLLLNQSLRITLDASNGTVEGVKALTLQAMKAGGTKEEIMETLRVAQYVSGIGCVYTAAHAYKDLF